MFKRPNILLIMTDQQRYDYLSVNGGQCPAPALERLAAEGAAFDNAYSVCSLCTPARASVLTGKYPHKHGLFNNCDMFSVVRERLPEDQTLINAPLAGAGYTCGYAGKWHIDRDLSALDHGFEGYSLPGYGNPWHDPTYRDHLAACGLTPPELIPVIEVENRPMTFVLDGPTEATVEHFQTDLAIDLLRKYAEDDGRPFFLTVQYWGPHEPARPTKEYADRFPPEDTPLVPSFEDTLEGRPEQYRRHRDEFECWYYGVSRLSRDAWRKATAMYYAYSAMIDDQVSRVLAELDALGLADDTLVLYTTDHGNLCGARGGLYDKGVAMFEDTYHIPLLARWPGVIAPGARHGQLVSNMDVFATILDVAGARVPDDVDSRSMAPILRDPSAAWPDDLMSWSSGVYYLHSQRMLRWDRYKYVFTPYAIDELYDLEADPVETENRIDDPSLADVRTEMRKRLIANATRAADPLAEVMQGYFRV